jgi:hypothetical protein
MKIQQKSRRGSKKRPNVLVVPRRKKFAVKLVGKHHYIASDLTQLSAVHIARAVSQVFNSELVIENKLGQIRYRDSHGNDPFPPKG